MALRVSKSGEDGKWLVYGRGVLHLSVLIETMRREGYELQVGQPQVLYKTIDGKSANLLRELTINVPEKYSARLSTWLPAVKVKWYLWKIQVSN